MKNLKQKNKNHWTKIFSIFLFFVLLGAYSSIFAIPPATKYNAGETLDPNCAPGDPNCSVEVSSSPWLLNGSDIYYNNGNVGIGTTSPSYKFSMISNLSLSGGIGGFIQTVPSGSSDLGVGTQIRGWKSNLLAGYTGNSGTSALEFFNLTSGAGDNPYPGIGRANFGIIGDSRGSTLGVNVGAYLQALNGSTNYGVMGGAPNSNNSPTNNIGVLGWANGSNHNVGGYFGLFYNSTPSFESSALIADNGTTTSPVFLARDNGIKVFVVNDGGNVGIGTINPTAVLHIKSGTSTTGTAPFKFTSGTLLTTPEDGAIEYDGSHYYATIGSTRYQLDQQGGGISAITIVNSSNLFSTGLTGTGDGVTTTNDSIFLGQSAGYQATSASYSNFFGESAGYQATNANTSNFIGREAGYQATDAQSSNFIGYQAGYSAGAAVNSVFLGSFAGRLSPNASNSIFIGNVAGNEDDVDNTNDTDDWSILIGYNTNTGGYSNSILLGGSDSGSPISNTKANQFMLADSITDVRWSGVEYILPSTQGGASTVLTNNGSGGLSWESPGSVSGSWMITGNAGTDGGVTNFIGTTDDTSLTFRVNNTKSGYIGNSTDSNVSLGYRAGINTTANKYLTAVGTYALENNTTGQANTGLGFSALRNNTTGYDNYALGHGAMAVNTTGHSNMSMGSYALYRANGNDNTAIGNASLYWLAGTASGNTAIGFHSMFSATSAEQNVSIGWAASNNLTTGLNNTIIGYGTGFGIDTGSGNTIIGANVTGLSGSLTNNIILADGTGNRRINVDSSGNVQFSSYGAGTLITDASGNITASSDERLKDIEGDFDNGGNALDIINSINPILYKWNDKSGFDQTTTYAGFSAQNIRDLIPEAVGTDPKGYLTLSDRPILATAINAIKELDLKVKALNEEIKSMTLGEMIKDFIENEANRFEKIFAKTVVTEGIEMKDTATGEDYCVVITNGEFEKVKGKCGEPIEDMSADNSSDSDESSSSDVAQDEESELGSDVGTEEGTIEQTEVPTEEGSSTTDEEEVSVDSPTIPSEEIPTDNTTITTTESVIEGQ